ncbi:MAG: repressor LexA [Bacteroidota bacterium]
MSRRQLTQKQHAFLQYLVTHVGEHKVWPTYREIVEYFGYRSPNSVTQNLQALAKKGFLQRDDTGYQLAQREQPQTEGIRLGGHIADGAVRTTRTSSRLVLSDLVPDLAEVRAYEIGEQPVEPETLAGSTHVLVGEARVPDGEIGVVMLDGTLALRRVYPEPEGWRLEALNGKEVTNHTPTEGVRVIGRYAGHAGDYGLVRDPLAFMHPDDVVADPDHAEPGYDER